LKLLLAVVLLCVLAACAADGSKSADDKDRFGGFYSGVNGGVGMGGP
jgi:hypothetical protein